MIIIKVISNHNLLGQYVGDTSKFISFPDALVSCLWLKGIQVTARSHGNVSLLLYRLSTSVAILTDSTAMEVFKINT